MNESQPQTPDMTYDEATKKLEEYVSLMQDDQCSIDKLSEYTKQSQQLLEFCRRKLTETDAELQKILADIQKQN